MDTTTLFKADIFFVITTLAVVLVTLMVIVGLGYIIEILASIRHIMKQAERATEHVAEDIDDLRDDLHRHGFSFRAFSRFFGRVHRKGHSKK